MPPIPITDVHCVHTFALYYHTARATQLLEYARPNPGGLSVLELIASVYASERQSGPPTPGDLHRLMTGLDAALFDQGARRAWTLSDAGRLLLRTVQLAERTRGEQDALRTASMLLPPAGLNVSLLN